MTTSNRPEPPHEGAPDDRLRDALHRRDANAVRDLVRQIPALRTRLDDPIFAFDSPAIVAFAADAAIVNVLLALGVDPNRRSSWWAGGFHALHVATGEAAERLIAAGAIPDACAAAHLDRVELLARLVEEEPARVHERGGDGQTPLHFARSREVADRLLAAGADIDARDVDHRGTPAEWMLERSRGAGRYELARYLVERGASADIFLTAALGLDDRATALLRSNPQLLELRTGKGDYAPKPPSSYHIYFWTIGDSRSPLDVAAQFEQPATVERMLGFATPLQRLLFACRRADGEQAHALVRQHPEIVRSMSPEQHRAVADAAANGAAGAVAVMLELGFNPSVAGSESGTALHLAAWEGSLETVTVLLRHGTGRALVSSRDAQYAATPLGWCCHGSLHGNTSHDHAGVARALLEAGARPGPDTRDASAAVQRVLAEFG